MDFIAHRGWMDSKLSRKVIHIGTGPLFVLCWFLFRETPDARWLAALVPFAMTVQFALIGLGVIKDEASVKAMSRTGDPKEILRGPLFYGIMFVVLTLIFWRDSPTGIVALMMLCGGDGIADLIGRSDQISKTFVERETNPLRVRWACSSAAGSVCADPVRLRQCGGVRCAVHFLSHAVDVDRSCARPRSSHCRSRMWITSLRRLSLP